MLFEKSRKEPDVAVDITPAHHSSSESGDYGSHDMSKSEAQGGHPVISDGVFGDMDDGSGPNYRAVSSDAIACERGCERSCEWRLTRSRSENGARSSS